MSSRKKSMTALCSFTAALLLLSQSAGLATGPNLLPLNYQNEELKKLAGVSDKLAGDTPAEVRANLEKIVSELELHQTLTLRRYSSGGHSAVTVQDPRSLESALDGMLAMHWDRDSIMQALAEYQISDDDGMRAKVKVAKNAWLMGLAASLKHHYLYSKKFIEIISRKSAAADYTKRPHIRYNPINLQEVQDPWGHAQNDALAYVLFLTFYAANQGKLIVAEKTLKLGLDGLPVKPLIAQKEAQRFGILVPLFFQKIAVWQDFDFGAWEDKKAEHASSIGCVLAALRQEKKYLDKVGPMSERIDGKEYTVTSALVEDMIKKCQAKLAQILPNEFINSDKEDKRADASKVRDADSAIVNALFLGAICGEPIVPDAMTERVIGVIEGRLARPIGFARYPLDIWDGRVDRRDLEFNEEAQWSHVAPMISVIYGEMYQRTKKPQYLAAQELYFKRSLTTVNSRWRIPEAYIIDKKSRKWVSDANEPLAWAQAVEIMAILAMRKSLAKPSVAHPVEAAKPSASE
jgi:phosphorylase kinase alpha/beta subunit